jgi:glycosyltransferase involved in cell wall biosynthesis
MTKVMVLTHDLKGGGGAERVLSNITLSLDGDFDFLLVAPNMNKIGSHTFPHGGRLRYVEVGWNENAGNPFFKLKNVFLKVNTLRKMILEENPDVVLSHYSLTWHKALIILKSIGLVKQKTILRFGNPLSILVPEDRCLIRRLFRLGLRHIDYIVVNSQGLRHDLEGNFGVADERIRVIPNPIDLAGVRALSESPLDMEPFSGKAPVVISVGRLSSQKNHTLLIRSFKKTLDEVDARLVIVGIGELEHEVKALAKRFRLEGSVYFLGWQDNPFKFMRRASLFVLSSDYEGFPNALIEAMAVGCPSISTDCISGPAEVLKGGECGVLVPPNDENAMAGAIVRLLRNEGLRRELSEKGMRRAEDFDISAQAEEYKRLIETLA